MTTTERTWSDQQVDIFDWFAKKTPGQSNDLVVRARAGTGKTTTILEGINRAPEKRILLAAFNKRIAEELAKKLTNPNAEARTLHALGFAAIRRYWERVRVANGSQRADALTDAVCEGTVPDAVKRVVSRLHTKAREMAPHATGPGELIGIAYQFDCDETIEKFPKFDLDWIEGKALLAMRLAASRQPASGIDFADMIFLPVRNHWAAPTYDLVVVDEAQDMTMAQLELAQLVSTAKRGGGRFCVVGDDRQAIYGFRGADSGSLDRLKEELHADELGLTTTYRCPKRVVEVAQEIVPDFCAADTAPDGYVFSIGRSHLVAMAEGGDFILSRKNAPLIEVAMECIRADVKVRVAGRDIGAGLVGLVRRLGGRDLIELAENIDTWENAELVKILQSKYPERADEVSDRAATLRVLIEGCAGIQEVIGRIGDLFSDDGDGSMVVCSTVHKAKGLEARRVFVLAYTLMGNKQSDRPNEEEMNIEYVAVTRAQETMVWVQKDHD